ncbi:MAG TPA: DUF6174 domain-containing protein [Gemmatimonadaceae bacterium]|nr:DUF6174 domain-containing protein [Gemmatimonadaceae bacterium]
MITTSFRLRGSLAALALLALAGCHDPTSVQSSELAARRARWVAHGLTSYEYDYMLTGFFIQFAGHRIHLVVRDGAVQTATDLTTGQVLAVSPQRWPTIDDLFDDAQRAADSGSLSRVLFDGTLDYPAEIDIAGPPDASGAVFATGLAALP